MLNLVESENDFTKENNILTPLIDEDLEIFLGKFRVMFGYRLRGGYLGECYCELDICCGSESEIYDSMLNKVKEIIKYNVSQNKEPFKNIPTYSKIKPYFKDEEFLSKINDLYNQAFKHNSNLSHETN